MEEHTAYVMFALERVKVCGPKMAILGKEGPRNAALAPPKAFGACAYCCGPSYTCGPGCAVETIEQGVKR